MNRLKEIMSVIRIIWFLEKENKEELLHGKMCFSLKFSKLGFVLLVSSNFKMHYF